MIKIYIVLKTLFKDKEGQNLVEYALLAGFIAVAAGSILPRISTPPGKGNATRV